MTAGTIALKVARLTASAWALAVLAMPGPASAQTNVRSNQCASLGEGFVAVAGSDACVRIGGHVRVEFGDGGLIPGGGGSARQGVRPASERSHVRAGSGWPDLFPR